jgi:hypothetical protein
MDGPGGGVTKRSLSAPRRRLVELMQRLHFGEVLGLHIRDGEPAFDPPPRLVRDIKLASDDCPRPGRGPDDFLLKAQVVELFQLFDRLRNGVIDLLDVRNGLPFRVRHTERLA